MLSFFPEFPFLSFSAFPYFPVFLVYVFPFVRFYALFRSSSLSASCSILVEDSGSIVLLSSQGLLELDLFRGTVSDPTVKPTPPGKKEIPGETPESPRDCIFSEIIGPRGSPISLAPKPWLEAHNERTAGNEEGGEGKEGKEAGGPKGKEKGGDDGFVVVEKDTKPVRFF
jgi:hypothetical protein